MRVRCGEISSSTAMYSASLICIPVSVSAIGSPPYVFMPLRPEHRNSVASRICLTADRVRAAGRRGALSRDAKRSCRCRPHGGRRTVADAIPTTRHAGHTGGHQAMIKPRFDELIHALDIGGLRSHVGCVITLPGGGPRDVTPDTFGYQLDATAADSGSASRHPRTPARDV